MEENKQKLIGIIKKLHPDKFVCQSGELQKVKIDYDKNGNIITVDSETGKKVGEIRTMGNDIAELEEKRLLREKAKKMIGMIH